MSFLWTKNKANQKPSQILPMVKWIRSWLPYCCKFLIFLLTSNNKMDHHFPIFTNHSNRKWKCMEIWLVVWNIFLMFPHIGNNHPNWRTHIFQRGGPTTNQKWLPSRNQPWLVGKEGIFTLMIFPWIRPSGCGISQPGMWDYGSLEEMIR